MTASWNPPGPATYEVLREALKNDDYESLNQILGELENLFRGFPVDSNGNGTTATAAIGTAELKLWIDGVGRLMFQQNSIPIKRLAIDTFEAAMPYFETLAYIELPAWPTLRAIVSSHYTSLLDKARNENDPDWHRIWSILVRLLHRDVCQGSTIINMFLSIVEAGFRAAEFSVREQAFDCWRLLVEVFARHRQINFPKRMRLICIPLKSSKSKTELIALKKFDIWWFLLTQLHDQLDTCVDTIFEPFIYFCFGPSFRTPLCYYFDESFKEIGAPGKIYQSVKQLSAIALINLLGPAPEVTKQLLMLKRDKTLSALPFCCPEQGMSISAQLFATKAKLLIDSCTECTVLLAQMTHLDYLELNRCLWRNLLSRAVNFDSKWELLLWFRDDMTALVSLCLKQSEDLALRELLYETLLIVAQSELLTVTVGYDSPEQLMLNYKCVMAAVLHPDLPCPESKSKQIVEHVFDLQRYTQQQGYWEMLQKTVQYLCTAAEVNHSQSAEFREIRTQIYLYLADYLIERIRDDPNGFDAHRAVVMNFLLYPLEFDQLVLTEKVQTKWLAVYRPIAQRELTTCDFANGFCETIKAMTVAKYSFNLGVVAAFLCHILESVTGDFDLARPPLKVIELFKDLTRKALAYKASMDRLDTMARCFRELLGRMSHKAVLSVIMPLRTTVAEMVANEHGLAVIEIKRILNVLAGKMISSAMMSELKRQPNEVRWNCKLMLQNMLQLPATVRRNWKEADIKKCIQLCDSDIRESAEKSAKPKADHDEFVVIESNWRFKPDQLTEHQLEKMKEKRTDIPALYNDMSQSQDSFIIKPWTPSKPLASKPAERPPGPADVTASADNTNPATVPLEDGKSSLLSTAEKNEPSNGKNDSIVSTSESSNGKKPDKENNYANMVSDRATVNDEPTGSGSEGTEQKVTSDPTQERTRLVLKQLRIDTVAGKSLDVMSLPRTRRSELPDARESRRKSTDPKRKVESEKKLKRTAVVTRSDIASASKVAAAGTVHDNQRITRTSRKNLNFENLGSHGSGGDSTTEDENIVESSQGAENSQSALGRKLSGRRRSRVGRSTGDLTPATDTKSSGKQLDDVPASTNPPSTSSQSESMEIEQTPSKDRANEPPMVNPEQTSGLSEPPAAIADAKDDTMMVSLRPDTSASKNLSPEPEREIKTNLVRSPKRITRSSLDDDRKEESIRQATQSHSPRHRSDCSEPVPAKEIQSPSRRVTRLSIDESDATIARTGSPSKGSDLNHNLSKRPRSLSTSPSKSRVADGAQQASCSAMVSIIAAAICSPKKMSPTSPVVMVEPINSALLANVKKTLADPINSGMMMPAEATDTAKESPKPTTSSACKQPDVDGVLRETEALSPVKNLDETMEPMNRSQNCTIVSSPDIENAEERAADLLNSTLNISPIPDEKSSSARGPADNGVLAGSTSADRRAPSSIMDKEREPSATSGHVSALMSRRSKASPQGFSMPTAGGAPSSAGGLRTRNQQHPMAASGSTSRSPSTGLIGLGGRGAHFISLIRGHQNDLSPGSKTPLPQCSSTPTAGQSSAYLANRATMRKRAIVASATSATHEGTASPDTGTMPLPDDDGMANRKEYLVFSKVLPSPHSSPAVSILKRRHNILEDSVDDGESPAYKRKRVSFHDPPVSVTKEYIRHDEECRSPSISRCLQLTHAISPADKAKFMMRRKSRWDSISELERFTRKQAGFGGSCGGQQQQQSEMEGIETALDGQRAPGDEEEEEEELTSSPESLDDSQFIIHDGTDTSIAALQVSPANTTSAEPNSAASQRPTPLAEKETPSAAVASGETMGTAVDSGLNFASEEALLQHVMQRYTLDDMLARYVADGRALEQSKMVRILTRELSVAMAKDQKTLHTVLDQLSERYSAEFLDHAIQENSSAMVCERVSATAMLDHIFKSLRRPAGASSSEPMLDTERLRLVQSMFEGLSTVPDIAEPDGQTTVAQIRERFLRQQVARKERLEMMTLIEDYFKMSNAL
ncbi:telomere-associated protein RIF1 [Anopheles cruzii]|uniref:telomere-associated protein RIF1 n=1 Tax=Anopheles cruzii TaxID=68878 RepID=UPI0022EC79CF|nr:telomere-associated protein RIF1 [Anopheles cruzii]